MREMLQGKSLRILTLFAVAGIGVYYYAAFLYPTPLFSVPSILACTIEDGYERTMCIERAVVRVAEKKSVERAYQTIVSLKRADILDDCHVVMHEIGRVNLEEHDGRAGAALSSCPVGCFQGCYHGVMETYVSRVGGIEYIHNQPETICSSLEEQSFTAYRQCLHGLGHGLIQHHRVDVRDAIEGCRNLESVFAQDTCIGGVMMEYVNTYIDYGTFLDHLPNLCNQFTPYEENNLRFQCLDNVGWGLMVYTGHDLEESVALCARLPESQQKTCISTVKGEAALNKRELRNMAF